MKKTYVLITDAHRARCFERNAPDHSLTELADLVHPQQGIADTAGKGHGRTGHAGTQFEPHTDAVEKEREAFARSLADYLDEAVTHQRCEGIILIATAPMLGELNRLLSVAANKAVLRRIASDLTHYQGPELQRRIDHALQLPD